MENDRLFLRKALDIAENGISEGGGPFGAVITLGNEIISQAFNKVVLTNDPTAHAEILAIREAASILKTHDLKDCVLYTSCEPCPMCLGAIYWAGIKKVFYACDRNDARNSGFSDKMIYEEIVLDPEKRTVEFISINDAGGSEVFRKWDGYENKIRY
jgi:tRNA(Arg) A34 adenosine deaminase TadA